MKKIDKLKNSSVNRIAKKSANLSSNLPSLVLREQNAATLSTQLHYAERQLFVPDWISKRDTRTSLSPPPSSYIWRSNREEPPRLSAILYPPTRARRDAVLPPPESSRLLHPFFPRYPFFLHLLVCPWRRGDNFSRRLSSIRPSFVGWQRTTRSPRTR